jgi:hypothetical protein
MDLRDEWISGGPIDEWVEEALPVERSWRALGWWWHSRNYRAVMGMELKKEDEEDDFFLRELEKMGWGVQSGGGDEEGEAVPDGPTEWDGGPLQLEGW